MFKDSSCHNRIAGTEEPFPMVVIASHLYSMLES